MIFKDFIDLSSIIERGKRITNEDIYKNHGSIKVISSKIDGELGYVSEQYLDETENINANHEIGENTFVYAIEGNAGYISLYKPQKIWLTDVAGIFDVKQKYIDKYGKFIIAIFLQDFFIKNRHNNSTQPKFLIKNILNKEIDLTLLDKLKGTDMAEVELEQELEEDVCKYYQDINRISDENKILLKDFIDMYIERGKRLVQGRDIYINHGEVKVMSSTTTGPMGYYNRSNYDLKENDFIYSIDGVNAGYISILNPQRIFITDHAGVISVKKKFIKKYGKISIAIFLQNYFVKKRSNGTQPTFLLKNNLNLELNLNELEILKNMKLDKYLL
ncbi:hypothetical protein ACQQ2T_01845 [Paraclostridium tenue]